MTTLMYRLDTERSQSEKDHKNNELTYNLLNSLRLFKGEISQENLLRNIADINLPEEPQEASSNSEAPLHTFLDEKLARLIKNLPEKDQQKPENKTDVFKDRIEQSTGIFDNFNIAFDFFKEVVWDYSINLFQIIIGSKNPAASLYEYTNEASKQILSNLKTQGVDTNTYNQVHMALQNINNNLWKLQKEQQIQNIGELVNFRLAGLIFASSFMLATLSIIGPVVGLSIGFSAVMSSLYLSAGVAGFSAASFVLSYLAKADLAIRGSDAYAVSANNFAESVYDTVSAILSPLVNFISESLGYETAEVAVEDNKDQLETACQEFVKTHSQKA